MNEAFMDLLRVHAVGKFEEIAQEIELLESRLKEVPHWNPGVGLQASCRQALTDVKALRERMERRLVVSIIGPAGSGKSTLLNALAGDDSLSEVGRDRPTTRYPIVYCKERSDADPLLLSLGENNLKVVASPGAVTLDHVILVDTPDTDSTACSEHQPIVKEVVRQSDILLCVFNSENPKRRDHLMFLDHLVEVFPQEHVFAILNHCDRRLERDLKEEIVPDFQQHLARSWLNHAYSRVFCICARSHLQDPKWPAECQPLHGFDQFHDLREVIFGSLNKGSVVIDTRIAQAQRFLDFVKDIIRQKTQPCLPVLKKVKQEIDDLKREAQKAALEKISETGNQAASGADLRLQQRVAQLWCGPIGWLLAVYSRFLVFGAGALNILRIGRPLRQLWGLVSTVMSFKRASEALDDSISVNEDGPARAYRDVVETKWPDIAEKLIGVKFDHSLRELDVAANMSSELPRQVGIHWETALNQAVEDTAQSLSETWKQALFNAPGLLLMAYVCIHVVITFLVGKYLPADYFRHALAAILLVWATVFTGFQFWVRQESGQILMARAIANLLPASKELKNLDAGQTGVVREIQALSSLNRLIEDEVQGQE